MNIQIVSEFFYPDNFRINEIVPELVKRGHKVSVLTALPDYETGYVPKTYRKREKRRENCLGAEVRRVFTLERKTGVLHRALSYGSFLLNGTAYALFCKKPKCDAVFVYETSPVFQLFPGIILSQRAKCPLVFYCCDLWPESLKAWNVKESSLLFRAVLWFSRWMYKRCDVVAVTSKPFRAYMEDVGGVPKEKIVYLPQHFADMEGTPFAYEENGRVDFLFAGNMGAVQNLDCVLRAAARMQPDKPFHIHFVGDGSEKEALELLAKDLRLDDKVTFHGRYPREEMARFYTMADCFLLTLRGGDMIGSTLPSKAQGYLCAGKPVVGAIDGAGAELIREADCGIAVPAGDEEALAKAMTEVTDRFEDYREKGKNGRRFYEDHFTMDQFMQGLEALLKGKPLLEGRKCPISKTQPL